MISSFFFRQSKLAANGFLQGLGQKTGMRSYPSRFSSPSSYIPNSNNMVYAGDKMVVKDRNDREVHVQISNEYPNVEEIQSLFVRGYMNAYRHIPLEQLHPTFRTPHDLQTFLSSVFVENFKTKTFGERFHIQAFYNQKCVGYISMEVLPTEKHAVYYPLLLVDPEFQRGGLGKTLIMDSTKHKYLAPLQIKNRYGVVRRNNLNAIEMYRRIGGRIVDFLPDGHNPEEYMGLLFQDQEFEEESVKANMAAPGIYI
jgi:ribosomal protein S18 acetylase RimI-like enzyme